jgi:hypothetical protein
LLTCSSKKRYRYIFLVSSIWIPLTCFENRFLCVLRKSVKENQIICSFLILFLWLLPILLPTGNEILVFLEFLNILNKRLSLYLIYSLFCRQNIVLPFVIIWPAVVKYKSYTVGGGVLSPSLVHPPQLLEVALLTRLQLDSEPAV